MLCLHRRDVCIYDRWIHKSRAHDREQHGSERDDECRAVFCAAFFPLCHTRSDAARRVAGCVCANEHMLCVGHVTTLTVGIGHVTTWSVVSLATMASGTGVLVETSRVHSEIQARREDDA